MSIHLQPEFTINPKDKLMKTLSSLIGLAAVTACAESGTTRSSAQTA